MSEKRIHIDTLVYTREGLATKEPIDLAVGEHNRIVLVRPDRRSALAFGSGSFASGSCFPTPGVLSPSMLAAAQNSVNLVLGLNPSSIFQVYGHADNSGSERDNKELSEKRAEAVRAILVADIASVQALASDEAWDLREHQIMLRTLRCDPGAIDGALGDVTRTATRLFQYEYLTGVFHRHVPDPSGPEPLEDLKVNGTLDEPTVRALLESYVLATSAQLAESQLHPTHPAVGCSEFNRADVEQDHFNRRVSLVVHQALPPHHDAAPCIAGDAQACPVDGREAHASCLWYREHVLDPQPSALVHRHFDLRWLPLPNGRVLLSALTTVPDGAGVSFQVFLSEPLSKDDPPTQATLVESLSEEIEGLVRGSVAQLVWEPPQGVNLFAPQVEQILEGASLEEVLGHRNRVRLPLFQVTGHGASALSGPPGRELLRIPAELPTETGHRTGHSAVDWFGGIYQQASHLEGRSDDNLHPLRSGEPLIWAHRHMNRTQPREDA